MTIDSNRFVINKGMNNEFIITIKQNDSTLPMVIESTDTFTVNFYNLETQKIEVSASTADGNVTVYDDANGQILISLAEDDVSTMISERGDKVDKYYLKPTYRMAIDCTTANNGNFVAKIASVYVEG